MKLEKLSIENYKSLKNINHIEFEDLTTIIGENDSGKTSILEFIEIMLTNKAPNELDYGIYSNSQMSDEIIGITEFKLSQTEIAILEKYLNCDKKLIIRKKFKKNSVQEVSVKTSIYIDDRLYTYKKMKTDELKDLLRSYGLEDKSNNSLRIEYIDEYLKNNEVDMKEDWKSISFSEVREYLPTIIKYGVDDYINPDNLIYNTLKLKFTDILYEKSPDGRRRLKDGNLQKIIDDIEDTINEISNGLLPVAKQINPSIKEINLEPDIDLSNGLRRTPITITEENGVSHYLNNFGQGTKKRMCMSIMEWTDRFIENNENIIKIYDEPDNNLHIEAQRRLFRTVRNSCETNGQAIICTHSPFIIDVSPTKSIRLVDRNIDGITSIDYIHDNDDVEIKKFIDKMCREVGLSNSHIFFEKCFLIVEGESEYNFFPIIYKYIFNSTLAEDGITLINLKGNGSALNFLKLLVENKENKLVLAVDSDSVNITKKKVISNLKHNLDSEQADRFFDNNIIFIGDKEFEDCFTNDYIARVLNKSLYKKNNEELWMPHDIEEHRKADKFSESIINMVNRYISSNSRCEFINKPILGTLLAENINETAIPLDINRVIHKIRQVSESEEYKYEETTLKYVAIDEE